MDSRNKNVLIFVGIFIAFCGLLVLLTNLTYGLSIYFASLFGSSDPAIWELAAKGAGLLCLIGGIVFAYHSYSQTS